MNEKNVLKINSKKYLYFVKGNDFVADQVQLYELQDNRMYRTYESKFGRIKDNGTQKQRLELFRDMITAELIKLENE